MRFRSMMAVAARRSGYANRFIRRITTHVSFSANEFEAAPPAGEQNRRSSIAQLRRPASVGVDLPSGEQAWTGACHCCARD
jgi:hypothetical protein